MALIKRLLQKGTRGKAALAILLLAGLAFSGFKFYKKKAALPKPGDADSELAEIKRGDLERRFREIGDLAALNRVHVASKVSGRVIELFVREGERVKAGQNLAVVQPGKTGAERFLPSTISSPIDGIVIGYAKDEDSSNSAPKFVEVGDYVTGLFESQTPTYLMTIADMSKVIVKLKINEMDILKLDDKMPVDVTIDALPEEKFPALVFVIAPQAEKEKRGGKVFRVEVLLSRNHAKLRTGMTARVDALLEKSTGVLTLPLSGLFEEKGKFHVFLERGKEKPKQIAVETGMRTETDIEVKSGLKEGDKVFNEKPVDFEPLEEKPGGPKTPENADSSRRQARGMRRAMRRLN